MKSIKRMALALLGAISALLVSGCINREISAMYGPPPMEQDLYGVPGIEEIEE